MAEQDSPRAQPQVRVHRARGFYRRLRGLLATAAPAPGEALHIAPCRQVHSFGMRYAIDVVHLDRTGAVLAVETLRPWRLGRFHWRAAGVLELAAGQADALGLRRGVRPRLIES